MNNEKKNPKSFSHMEMHFRQNAHHEQKNRGYPDCQSCSNTLFPSVKKDPQKN